MIIGVVLARTGRLAPLGEPVDFVADLLAPKLRAGLVGIPIEIAVRDSASTVAGARAATERLITEDGARIVITVGGSAVLPAVAGTCHRLGTPCVSTTLPWQVYRDSCPPSDRAFHFCWGLDDVASVFADMWERAAGRTTVGCLWNDGSQGRALREDRCGFLPVARLRGHDVVHQPAYSEGTADFAAQVETFRDVAVITSAASASDLGAFLDRATESGLRPALVTCSRWLTYPFWRGRHELDGVATIVSWTPSHRYLSTVDGSTPAQLASAYELATGRPWAQPLGLAYAVFEIAAHALAAAADPDDPAAVADAVRTLRLDTMAGRFDLSGGPAPGIARIALAGGQWQGDRRLSVVRSRIPAVAPDAALVTR